VSDDEQSVIDKDINFKSRSCEECNECCTLLSVRSIVNDAGTLINKSSGERCQYECNKTRCSIYDTRPIVCRNYFCSWVLNDLDLLDEQRPDKIECVFNVGPVSVVDGTLVSRVIHVHPKNMSILASLAPTIGRLSIKHTCVLIINDKPLGIISSK
jgi:hypothetical protein